VEIKLLQIEKLLNSMQKVLWIQNHIFLGM